MTSRPIICRQSFSRYFLVERFSTTQFYRNLTLEQKRMDTMLVKIEQGKREKEGGGKR